jgi:hypothetical protein
MPRKFWLMPGLEFHKLRAEMPPNQWPMLGFILCMSYGRCSRLHIGANLQTTTPNLRLKIKGHFRDHRSLRSSNA